MSVTSGLLKFAMFNQQSLFSQTSSDLAEPAASYGPGCVFIMADGRAMANSEHGSSSSDESLDVYSPNFDPLKALYSPKVRVPVKEAPVYDNVQKFESVLKGIAANLQGKKSRRIDETGQEGCSRRRINVEREVSWYSFRYLKMTSKKLLERTAKLDII